LDNRTLYLSGYVTYRENRVDASSPLDGIPEATFQYVFEKPD